jgi:L-threonylcarbamoyladenylate synthase
MAETLDRRSFDSRLEEMLAEIGRGKVFVYPTDTIYGIGCDATNGPAVARIRSIKKRDSKPFSVIAPSVGWIEKNCVLDSEARIWIKKLPGPYTLVLRLSKGAEVAWEVNSGLDTVGVRIPDNWFAEVVAVSGRPFVTTSVNISGMPHMTSPMNMDRSIGEAVDYIIDEGLLENRPSKVVNLAAGGIARE